MEILNFESNGSNRSPKKRARIATVIGGAFLLAAVGSTFAANVTINTSNSLEYGQGLTQAAACNPSIKIIPTNKFVNSAGGGAFYLETLTVQDTTTATAVGIGLGNCDGKTSSASAATGNALQLAVDIIQRAQSLHTHATWLVLHPAHQGSATLYRPGLSSVDSVLSPTTPHHFAVIDL
jgi:hypothetical protein